MAKSKGELKMTEMDKNTKKFIDVDGEEMTKKEAVIEKVYILWDMYIAPQGMRRIKGANDYIDMIYWGLFTNDRIQKSEDLDKICAPVIRDEMPVGEFAERVSDKVDWIGMSAKFPVGELERLKGVNNGL